MSGQADRIAKRRIAELISKATSHEASLGPSWSQLNDIATMTFSSLECKWVLEVLDKQLKDRGKSWQCIFQSLVVLHFCLFRGHNDVFIYFRGNILIIEGLKKFQYIDRDGKDQGACVRTKAKLITDLLMNEPRFRKERQDAAAWHHMIQSAENTSRTYPRAIDRLTDSESLLEEMLSTISKLRQRVTDLDRECKELKTSQIISGILFKTDSVAGLRGENAQSMVDFLAKVLASREILLTDTDRRHILHLLRKLAKSSHIFPKCTELIGVQCDLTKPVNDSGGNGLIYKGVFKEEIVCVKAVRRMYELNPKATKVLRAQTGELALLAHISHRNIIPLYGAYLSKEVNPRICIVTPWMDNGDLVDYLEKFPNTPRLPLMSDVAAGLQFLHDLRIIHADLKARNVLVSQSQRAMLGDFGVSTILNTNVGTTTAGDFSGTVYWMAPELLIADKLPPPTQQSDMWGFGCICFEAVTGQIPFMAHYMPPQLMAAFVLVKPDQEITPLQPKPNCDPVMVNGGPLMELAEKCWKYNPSQRPTAAEALQFLTQWNLMDYRPSTDAELATFEACKSERGEVNIDYDHLLSIIRKLVNLDCLDINNMADQ